MDSLVSGAPTAGSRRPRGQIEQVTMAGRDFLTSRVPPMVPANRHYEHISGRRPNLSVEQYEDPDSGQ